MEGKVVEREMGIRQFFIHLYCACTAFLMFRTE